MCAACKRMYIWTDCEWVCGQVDQAKVVIWMMWIVVLFLGEVVGIHEPLGWMRHILTPITFIRAEVGGEPAPGLFEMVFGHPKSKVTEAAAAEAETKKTK
jgi:hypothetical protein